MDTSLLILGSIFLITATSSISFGETKTISASNDSLIIEFGGRTKVNLNANVLDELKAFFGDTLGLRIESARNYDRVHFNGGDL
ncbi:MAG: hypothetical protein RJQ09_10705 [Cyclobacteriaceae bacterium]